MAADRIKHGPCALAALKDCLGRSGTFRQVMDALAARVGGDRSVFRPEQVRAALQYGRRVGFVTYDRGVWTLTALIG